MTTINKTLGALDRSEASLHKSTVTVLGELQGWADFGAFVYRQQRAARSRNALILAYCKERGYDLVAGDELPKEVDKALRAGMKAEIAVDEPDVCYRRDTETRALVKDPKGTVRVTAAMAISFRGDEREGKELKQTDGALYAELKAFRDRIDSRIGVAMNYLRSAVKAAQDAEKLAALKSSDPAEREAAEAAEAAEKAARAARAVTKEEVAKAFDAVCALIEKALKSGTFTKAEAGEATRAALEGRKVTGVAGK